jgi:hypothetical protein
MARLSPVEEARRLIDAQVLPEGRESLRSLVNNAASKVALAMLHRDEIHGINSQRQIELTRQIEKLSHAFAHAFSETLRRSSMQHRYLVLDDMLYALLRDTLRNRASVWTNSLVERFACEKSPATFTTPNWPTLLSEQERAAIDHALRFPQWSSPEVDEAYTDFVITVSWISCVQLLVVGVRASSSEGFDADALHGLFVKLLPLCEYDSDTAINAVRQLSEQWKEHLADESDSVPREPIHGRTAGLVLVAPMPWDRFCVHLREHLPDAVLKLNSLNEPEPGWWQRLCDDSEQLLVLWGWGQVNHGPSLAEHRLREIGALAHCLRAVPIDGDNPEGSIECAAYALILDAPLADGRPPFEGTQVPRSHIGRTFRLSGSPFGDVKDLNRVEGRGFRAAYAWLRSGTERASTLGRALDCYVSATNIGGLHGSIAPEFEDAWRTVALWTCLEVLFCEVAQRKWRDKTVNDQAETILRRLGVPDAAQRIDVIRRAHECRNAAVHAAGLGLSFEDLCLFSDSVRVLIGDVIRTASRG